MPRSAAPLFTPFTLNGLTLNNRIVMAPMTRAQSPGGIPNKENAAYYRRRAEDGCGLIITEGTSIEHPVSTIVAEMPKFHGADALNGWKRVVDEVHDAGGRIFPQLWHAGMSREPSIAPSPHLPSVGPSGITVQGEKKSEPMSKQDIRNCIDAYIRAAVNARELGFDGIEVHGAHGYLIDQFFWDVTNRRDDEYGGDLVGRTRFAVEIIEGIRREIGHDFPLTFRLSQWKMGAFDARLTDSPDDWEKFLVPLSDAGVDMFHLSQRRFWAKEFESSPESIAAWTRRLTGKPVMSVGSVGLSGEFHLSVFEGAGSDIAGIDTLIEGFEQGDFDLIAVGRAILNDHEWVSKIRDGRFNELKPLDKGNLANYY